MKRMFLTTTFLLCSLISVLAQDIPNSGFESWTNGNPDNWTTTNVTGLVTPVTQSTDAHSGSSAVKLEIVSYAGFAIPTYLASGSSSDLGFPVTGRPGSVTGYYKFSPQSPNDYLLAAAALYKGGTQREGIAAGEWTTSAAASGYTQFAIPLQYISTDSPDTIVIYFTIRDTTGATAGHPGTFALIDDLAYGPAAPTSVDSKDNSTISSYALEQNFPNPFNPTTIIKYSVPRSTNVELKVYNVLGNEITTLVNQQQEPGNYSVKFDGTNLASGVYFYTLRADGFIKTAKMILAK